VDGLLREGAGAEDAATLRDQQLTTARWLEGFLAPGYGPHGAAKLVVTGGDGEATWVRSPALALRETGSGPLLAPYVDLAARLHQANGDGATAAVLLTARLVAAALREASPAPPTWLEGYQLAARQAKAWLAANEAKSPAAEALAHVAEAGWAAVAVQGLARMAKAGEDLDLDAIDVRAEPEGPAWLDGVVLDAKDPPRVEGTVGVLVLDGGWSAKPRVEGAQATVRTTAALAGLAGAEDALRRRASSLLLGLGVGLVVCAKAIDEDLRGLLLDAGVAFWTDAPKSALRRLEAATGAKRLARLEDATAQDVGRASLVRRRPSKGWLVRGAGPSATFVVPAHSKPSADAAVEAGERLLRAAGAVLPEARSRALQGGGRWQRGLAASLRKAADLAPGKAPIAVHAAADAVDALADDLLRNAGRDALAGGVLADAEGVLDASPCVRRAVAGAFETATALLRLDAAYAKRSSSAAGLRGGTGRSGSPKGMPGDIPPLM
jgi:chaperonin GroEL (HSP60 family)